MLAQQQGRTLIDFTDGSVAQDFRAVDDRIMGGSSVSRVIHAVSGFTSFEGDLIVEGGGFASVRYDKPFLLPPDCEALSLEACGDGRMGYKITLQTPSGAQGISYQYVLPLDESASDEDGFTTLRIPLSAFKASVRGRSAPEAPPLRAADVRSLGLMLSRYEPAGGGPKESIKAGPFQLLLRRLAVADSDLAINGRRWVQKVVR